MATLKYDIDAQYIPNLTQQGDLTINEYSPILNLSTSNNKIDSYVIDLTQTGEGIPSILYSIDLTQASKGTPSIIYSIDTNQSATGTPSTVYSVDTNQFATDTPSTVYSIDTDQSSTNTPSTVYSVDTAQSSTGRPLIEYSVDTAQSSTGLPNNQMDNIDTAQSSTGQPANQMPILNIPPGIGTQIPRQYQQPSQQSSGETGPIFLYADGTSNENTFLSKTPYSLNTITLNASPTEENRPSILENIFKGLNAEVDLIQSSTNQLTNRVAAGASALLGLGNLNSSFAIKGTYETLPFSELKPNPNLAPGEIYQDFRSRLSEASKRTDGAAAALRGSSRAGAYSAATLSSPGGAYPMFNLERTYGFPNTATSVGKDFTQRSEVATTWNPLAGLDLKTAIKTGTDAKSLYDGTSNTGGWVKSKNPLEATTQFTGDKVTVIDFGKRSNSSIYQWKPEGAIAGALNKAEIFGSNVGESLGIGRTNDLIKFFFTGPKLYPGSTDVDDVIVFRAIIGSMTDSFTGNWNQVQFIGRADPNYTYQGFSRNFDINFTVYASHRDELKPIYRKLNYLAGFTAPEYSDDTLVMKAPYLRITVGDLLVQQPIAITTIFYTFQDAETTWEINIEKDPTNMEVPKKIDVNLSGFLITDYLPQKGGRFYTLAKEFDDKGQPKPGNNDWLSDAIPTQTKELSYDELSKRQKRKLDRALKREEKKVAKENKKAQKAYEQGSSNSKLSF